MDTRERDAFLSFLFDRDGCELVNIKFFRGSKKVAAEVFCREAHRALRGAIENPRHVVPISGRTKMSRKELVELATNR